MGGAPPAAAGKPHDLPVQWYPTSVYRVLIRQYRGVLNRAAMEGAAAIR